jgi:hypothetical protein
MCLLPGSAPPVLSPIQTGVRLAGKAIDAHHATRLPFTWKPDHPAMQATEVPLAVGAPQNGEALAHGTLDRSHAPSGGSIPLAPTSASGAGTRVCSRFPSCLAAGLVLYHKHAPWCNLALDCCPGEGAMRQAARQGRCGMRQPLALLLPARRVAALLTASALVSYHGRVG